MKYIVRIVVSAFALISAAACYNNEIDNPDNPQNPEQSGLRITATMAKTRVNYGNETDAQLLPEWEEGDILFGFYVDGSKVIQNFILEVVDTSNSTATLDFVKGKENGLADQPLETKVYLIYTGKNGDSSIADTDIFSSVGVFSVDLTSQDLDHIPVCMSATATISGTDDAKTLSFNFAYDCAVLEVETLAGFDENGFAPGSLSGIEVSGISFMGKYSYDNGNITFAAVADDTSYSQSLDGWSVSADSELTCSGETKKILISAIPTSSDDITISYKRNDSNICSETFSNRTLAKGNCYVIRHNYVAKTSDNHYFETVAEAFDYVSMYPDFNTVTLVRKHIDGLGKHPGPDEDLDASLMVEIDYDVTLDLNGCTLSLIDADVDGGDDTSECFYVYAYSEKDGTGEGHLTIKDSRSGGTIESNSASDIVTNSGIVTVNSGALVQNTGCGVVYNEGQLNVNGGELYSNEYITVDNYGTLIMNDGELHSDGHCAIWNNPSEEDSPVVSIVVNGGYIHSSAEECNIKSQSSSSVTIYGGKLESENSRAIESQGSVVVGNSEISLESRKKIEIVTATSIYCYGGTFDMHYGDIYGPIDIENTVCHIYGGYIENTNGIALKVHDGAQCTISGGMIFNQGDEPAVTCYCFDNDGQQNTKLVIQWPIVNGLINQNRGEEVKEPLIYNSYNNSDKYPLFTTVNATAVQGDTNYAEVEIKGGYFCSNVNNFYCQNYGTPLNTSSFSNFYTNVPYVIMNSSNALDPLDSGNIKYDSDKVGGAKVQSSIGGFELPFGGTSAKPLTTGTMYYVSKQSNSSSTVQNDSYYFDGFDW